jgi:hypothetical protein
MDVVLHVGAHRTASTTFQKTLGANGAALAEAGIVYWGPKCTRAGLFDGLIGAAGTARTPAMRLAGLRPCGVAGAAGGCARARGILLVSEENVLGSMRAALSGAGSTPMRGRACGHRGGGLRRAPADDRDGDAGAGRVVALGSGRSARRGGMGPALCDDAGAQPRDWRDVIDDVARCNGLRVRGSWSGATRRWAIGPRRCSRASTARRDQAPGTAQECLRSGGGAPLSPDATPRGSDNALPPISTGLRAGADGLAEFIDAGPGQTKSRPGQDKEGDDPMTENSKITNAWRERRKRN